MENMTNENVEKKMIYQDSWKSFKATIDYNMGMAEAIVTQNSVENVEFAISLLEGTLKIYKDAIEKSKEEKEETESEKLETENNVIELEKNEKSMH